MEGIWSQTMYWRNTVSLLMAVNMQSKVGVRGQVRIGYGAYAVVRRGELHLLTVVAAVYNLKIFHCAEWITANITLPYTHWNGIWE